MRSRVCALAAALLLGGSIAGCAISGTWKRTAVDPPHADFPIDYLSISRDSRFTATSGTELNRKTSTGRLHGSAVRFRLDFDGDGIELTGRRRGGGRLLLIPSGQATPTATLERVSE